MRVDIYPGMVRQQAPERLRRLEKGDPGTEHARLREAAKEFEALMAEQMIRAMRKNVPQSELFGQTKGRELFQEMLDGEYARLMTARGGLGLADLLVRQLDARGPDSTGLRAQVSGPHADGETKRAISGQ